MKIIQPIGTIAGTAISKIAITLAEEFARQGHESTLVVWNRDKIERQIDPRVKIIRVNLIGVSRRNAWTKLLRLFFKPILGSRLFLVFMAPLISRQLQKKVLNKGNYDVVVLHAHAVFNFRFIKTPYLVVAHSTKSKQLLRGAGGWKRELLIRIYRQVYAGKEIVTVSNGIRTDFINEFGLKPDFMRTIYNPLDIKSILILAKENSDNNFSGKPYVIALGRNDPQKRFDRLIRIYAEANIKEDLIILGRANENSVLHDQVKSLGIKEKVHFLGFLENPYAYISRAKCLLMTSDYEGFGMVLAEALALGTPVISTDCPSGPKEILGSEFSDWLVPLDDEAQFARKLCKISKEPYSVPADCVEKFDKRVIATKYIEHIKDRVLT